jgi:hypothetical protein
LCRYVGARKPGANKGAAAYVPNLFYNLAVPGAYGVVRMEAILPHEREAGLPGRVNLLQEAEPKGGVLEQQGWGGGKGGAAAAGKGGGKGGGEKGWFGWWGGERKGKGKEKEKEEKGKK